MVPSPLPMEILEIDALRRMADAGFLVIAAGGGGVPVSTTGDVHGVEAVIDKDLTAAVLATGLGADALILVTGVEAVMVDFGTPEARVLRTVSATTMLDLLEEGQFPAGSMGPKVKAAVDFVLHSEGTAVITSAAHLADALAADPKSGTRVVPDEPALHPSGAALEGRGTA